MEYEYSSYQKNIFDFIANGTGDLLVQAVAGSGKTTTIIESLKFIPEGNDVLFLAFNKSNVDSLKTKVMEGVEVKTLHSLGFQALMSLGRRKVDENKIPNLVRENIKKYNIPVKLQNGFIYKIAKLVDYIRNNFLEHKHEVIFDSCFMHGTLYTEEEIKCAIEILELSERASSVDFIDMIYLPVKFNLKVKKFDYVYIDECQDLSKLQQLLFLKTKKVGARHIAVGDVNQAIYGFAGADVNSFNNLKNLPNTTILPLSVCYRCKNNIVDYVKPLVSEIESFSNLDEGIIRDGCISELTSGDLVLCRNTKPLFELSMLLFEDGKKSFIKGHEFGKEMVKMLVETKAIMKSAAKIKLEYSLVKLENRLRNFGIPDPSRTNVYKNLSEKIDIIVNVLFNYTTTVKQTIDIIEDLFSEKVESNRVTLSTIHRSKGFESKRVFVLNRELMPSKQAVTDWEIQQEKNLEYVCYTRAMDELVFVTLPKE
jgi:DNA helicase-2/ATP-dependent DNA helicase PcrA